MCELLVCVVDKTSDDPVANTKLEKAGDVMQAHDDGAGWSDFEESAPNWRILAVPGATVQSISALITAEMPTGVVDPHHPPRMLQYRGHYLQLSDPAMPADLAAYLADNTRAIPRFVIPATYSFTILVRPPVPDPATPAAPSNTFEE